MLIAPRLLFSALFLTAFFSISLSAQTDRPQLQPQIGHAGDVSCIAISPDGQVAATGGSDRTVRLWHIASGRELRSLTGHRDAIKAIAFSPDGRQLVTGGRDASVRFWDATTGKMLAAFAEHKGTVTSLVFSRDGKLIVSASADQTVKLWDAANRKMLSTLSGHNAKVTTARFTSDQLAIASADESGALKIWNVRTGQAEQTMQTTKMIQSLAVAPSDKFVYLGCNDGVRVWNLSTGQEARAPLSDLRVNSLALSADGQTLVAGGSDQLVRLRNLNSNPESLNIKVEKIFEVLAVALLPDVSSAMVGGAWFTHFQYNLNNGKPIREFQGESALVTSLHFSADGRYLLAGGRETRAAHLWDLTTGREESRFYAADEKTLEAGAAATTANAVNGARFSPDEQRVLLQSDARKNYLWDAENRKLLAVIPARGLFSTFRFSADGKWLAVSDSDQEKQTAAVVIYHAATGKEARRLNGHTGEIKGFQWSDDGRLIVSSGGDKTVRLWNASSGAPQKVIDGFENELFSLALSTDAALIAVTDETGAVRVYETRTAKELWQWKAASEKEEPQSLFYSVQFAPDGSRLFISTSEQLRVCEAATGRELYQINEQPDQGILGIRFSPDGRFFVAGSSESSAETSARLYETASGKLVRKFAGHLSPVSTAAFSPDGKLLATGSWDTTTRLWRVESGEELVRLLPFRDETWTIFAPDGRFDANNLEQISGLHWMMPDAPFTPFPIELFMREYYEPRLLPKILSGEKLRPLKFVNEINRAQPRVVIKNITSTVPDKVSVAVEITEGMMQLWRNGQSYSTRSGAWDLHLFRNGQLVAVWPRDGGEIKLSNGQAEISFDNIRLPRNSGSREVEFTAFAFNSDRVKGLTARRNFALPNTTQMAKGRAYLITIGVNAYENSAWNLKFAANDAVLMQQTLTAQLNSSGQFEQVVSIPLLSDYQREGDQFVVTKQDATKENIRTLLAILAGEQVSAEARNKVPNAALLRAAQPEDLILLSVSSHGYADANGVFYLVPYDTGQATGKGITNELLARCISSDELSRWMQNIDAGEMILIVDACHAAAAVDNPDFKPGPMGSRGFGQLSYNKGMRILTATQADNVALEKDRLRQGLLSYALLQDGLSRQQADYKPRNNAITLAEWLAYGVARVPKLYQEVRSGQLQKALVHEGSGEAPRKTQQPALFDFVRKRKDFVLWKAAASAPRRTTTGKRRTK